MTYNAKDYKVVALRDIPMDGAACDTPERSAAYWRHAIPTHPFFNPECECFVALLLNTRQRVKGHAFIATGLLDSVSWHPREVFRPAIVAAAHSVVLMHNHPSGDPTPSEADIRTTRCLIRAGELLKIQVLDHVVMGAASAERDGRDYYSLRECGYFS